MDLNAIVHPSAEKAGRFLVPWMAVHPWDGLDTTSGDLIVADFGLLPPLDLQKVLRFLPQHTLFVHTGEEDSRPIFSTHFLSMMWEDAGLEWQARKLFLEAAARKAEVKPFLVDTFLKDFMSLTSGMIGLKKGIHSLEIYFHNGRPVFLRGSAHAPRLGAVLTRKNLCEESSINEALACQSATGFPFGACLMKKATLTREDLQAALKEQAILLMEAQAHMLPADEIWLPLNLDSAAWDPIPAGKHELAMGFLRALPRWPGEAPLEIHPQTEVVSAVDPKTLTTLSLTPSQFYLLSQISGVTPWRTAYSAVPGNPFDKEKDAMYLWAAGLAKVEKLAKRLNPFEEAVDLAEAVGKMTLFEVLAVTPASTEDQIRSAYFDLAKKFHPDKFSKYPEFHEHQKMLEDLFATVNQAYQILRDPIERMKYLREKEADKPKATDLNIRARELYGEARSAMSQKQYGLALQRLNEIIYIKKADSQTYLLMGQCYLKGEEKTREAETALKKCLDMDPKEADAHFYLGQVYLKGGLKSRAVKSFQKVLELNPTHLDAAQWLKDLEAP